jgi:hypothetical protein
MQYPSIKWTNGIIESIYIMLNNLLQIIPLQIQTLDEVNPWSFILATTAWAKWCTLTLQGTPSQIVCM